MNPFDWRGPDFLVGYLALALLTIGALAAFRRRLTCPGASASGRLTDPYDVALLRGGPGEAVRVAVMSLYGRRLLERDGAGIVAIAAPGAVADDLERAVLAATASRRVQAWKLVRDPHVLAALAPRRARLAEVGLAVPSAGANRLRTLAWSAGVALAAIAITKIAIAIGRGHFNVLLLILLAATAVAVVIGLRRDPRATRSGRGALAELQTLFRGLRPTPGREVTETVFLTAIYGPTELAGGVRQLYGELFPRSAVNRDRRKDGSGCGSGCGSSSSSSSCGAAESSSSGSSCSSSSSCGGGGCGGCGS